MKKAGNKSTSKILWESNKVKLKNDGEYRPWLPSPPKLREYAGNVVDQLPMPICWEWSLDEVEDWLSTKLGLPQYKDCFRRNSINGRRLMLLEIFGLEKCGICKFSHIQIIMKGIRELMRIEELKSDRSISLPPRYPWTHYLIFRIPSGPSREATTPCQLFQRMGILDEPEVCPFDHWQMIEPDGSQPAFPYNRFGLISRKSVYRRVEYLRQPRGHTYLKKSKLRSNYFNRVDVK